MPEIRINEAWKEQISPLLVSVAFAPASKPAKLAKTKRHKTLIHLAKTFIFNNNDPSLRAAR